MDRKKIVTGIGELLWDLLPEGKQLGGAPCNFVFHASQAGCEAFVVSAIGDDMPGEEIRQTLNSLNINDNYLQTNSYATGSVSVILNSNGNPDYTIHENVAWDSIRWNNELVGLAKETDAVCFGSLAQRRTRSRETINKFLHATSHNCLKVFDINLRQNFYTEEIIYESFKHANILKLNEEELPVITTMFSLEGNVEKQLVTLLERFGLKFIAYTMGAGGSKLLNKSELSFVKSPMVKVEDTVGAGDSFTAIMVAGILNGVSLKEIHEKATEVSAYVCQNRGATPVIDKDLLKY